MSPRAVSDQEAIRCIKPGSSIFIGESCAEPQTLVEALVADRERLKGSKLIECRRFPGAIYAGLTDYFRILTLHVTSDYRDAVQNGRADFLTIKLSEMGRLFRNALPIDVALIQISTPLRNVCSLSVGTGFTLDAAVNARMVIAEVNQKMPRTYGKNSIAFDSIAYTVESSRPVLEYPKREVEETEHAVGKNIAMLIPDGSVLAIGIGSISESAMSCLDGKRNIGIHSGMITDGVAEAMQKGIITNLNKNVDKGKTVTGIAMGTQKLFDFMNENPSIETHPYSYTHDIQNISRIDNFVSINSAVEVDLTGQVNAESLGPLQISTIGGQADFIRGAGLSRAGRSVIALSSTTRDGKYSRIVPDFKQGAIISTPRYDVHYVVTEYGIAELWGKTMKQRRDALISIASPKFRDNLRRAATLV